MTSVYLGKCPEDTPRERRGKGKIFIIHTFIPVVGVVGHNEDLANVNKKTLP